MKFCDRHRHLCSIVVIHLVILFDWANAQDIVGQNQPESLGFGARPPYRFCLSDTYSLSIETSSLDGLRVWFVDSKCELWDIWSSAGSVTVENSETRGDRPITITLLDSDIRLALSDPGRSPISIGFCRFVIESQTPTRVTLRHLSGSDSDQDISEMVAVSGSLDQQPECAAPFSPLVTRLIANQNSNSAVEWAVIWIACTRDSGNSKWHIINRRMAEKKQRRALQAIVEGKVKDLHDLGRYFGSGLSLSFEFDDFIDSDKILSRCLIKAMFLYYSCDLTTAEYGYFEIIDCLHRIRSKRPTQLVLAMEIRVREAMYYHLRQAGKQGMCNGELSQLLVDYRLLERTPSLRRTSQLGSLLLQLEILADRIRMCHRCRDSVVAEAKLLLKRLSALEDRQSREYIVKYLRAMDIVAEIHRTYKAFDLCAAYTLDAIDQARLAKKVVGVGTVAMYESAAYLRLADIAFEVGDIADGVRWLQEAITLLESNMNGPPGRRVTGRLVAVLVRLSELCRFLEDVDGLEETLGDISCIIDDGLAATELPAVTRWAVSCLQSEVMWHAGDFIPAIAIKEAIICEIDRSLLGRIDQSVRWKRKLMGDRLVEWLTEIDEVPLAKEIAFRAEIDLSAVEGRLQRECDCIGNVALKDVSVECRDSAESAFGIEGAEWFGLSNDRSWPTMQTEIERNLKQAVESGNELETIRLALQLTISERRWASSNMHGLAGSQQHLLWQRGLRAENVLVRCVANSVVDAAAVYDVLRERKCKVGRGRVRGLGSAEYTTVSPGVDPESSPFMRNISPLARYVVGDVCLEDMSNPICVSNVAGCYSSATVEIDILRVSGYSDCPDDDGPCHYYVAFVVLPDGEVRFVELGDGEEIDREVKRWRWEIQAGGDEENSGKWLRERIWDPLEEVFPPEVTRVYLCPDGDLGFVPWGALPGRETGTVLLDQFALALVPHAGWFRHRSSGKGIVETDLTALPASRVTVHPRQGPSRDAAPISPQRTWGSDGGALMPLGTAPHSPSLTRPTTFQTRRTTTCTPSRWLIVGDVDYNGSPADEKLPGEHTKPPLNDLGEKPVELVSVQRPGVGAHVPRWSPLPHSRLEMKTLAGYLPETQRTELTGRQATRSRVLEELPQSRWAHLATHGFHAGDDLRVPVGLENPEWLDAERRRQQILLRRHPFLLTGLVLAGGNQITPPTSPGVPAEPRPILTGEDVAQLKLDQLELVVLSSCESGMGEVLMGEGVFGLQRAFHLAGAQNVVASLWQVDDEATAVLMKWFYFFLFEEQLPPMEALRQAQRTLRQHGPAATLLAHTRGPNFRQQARQLVRQSPQPSITTAPTRLWAGFFLSGIGD